MMPVPLDLASVAFLEEMYRDMARQYIEQSMYVLRAIMQGTEQPQGMVYRA